MSGVARRNVRIAQAAATSARAKEYRWQVPAEALGLREGSFLLGRRTSGDGSGGGFGVGHFLLLGRAGEIAHTDEYLFRLSGVLESDRVACEQHLVKTTLVA